MAARWSLGRLLVRLCCNGSRFPVSSMGVALYLALVGGGLTAAFMATVVLKGVRLI